MPAFPGIKNSDLFGVPRQILWQIGQVFTLVTYMEDDYTGGEKVLLLWLYPGLKMIWSKHQLLPISSNI